MEKNSVRNLQYGPKTRLIRGMYVVHVLPYVYIPVVRIFSLVGK